MKHRRNLIWLGIIAAGWLAVAGSAILTRGFTEQPKWGPSWHIEREVMP